MIKKLMLSLSISLSVVQLAAMEAPQTSNKLHCTPDNAYEFLVQRKQWAITILKQLDEIPMPQSPVFASSFLVTCSNLINMMYINFSKNPEARPFPLPQTDNDILVKKIQESAMWKALEFSRLFTCPEGLTHEEVNTLREKVKSEIVLDGLEKTFNYLLIHYPGLKDIFRSFHQFWMDDWS